MKNALTIFIIIVLAVAGCKSHRGVSFDQSVTGFKTNNEGFFLMAQDFWEDYPFSDTLWLSHKSETAQSFLEFLNLLSYLDSTQCRKAINNAIECATPKNITDEVAETNAKSFCNLVLDILYDPNSPYRNEDLYIMAAEKMLLNTHIQDIDKEATRHQLKLATKNRPGDLASDFTFVPAKGNTPQSATIDRTMQLMQLKSEYLIILFNNPYCPNCKEVTEQMVNSMIITTLLEQQHLNILTVYVDENLKEWNDYLPQLPQNWTNAYNPESQIINKQLYDMRAIPTLYLLDKEKKIILKDCLVPQIEAELKKIL